MTPSDAAAGVARSEERAPAAAGLLDDADALRSLDRGDMLGMVASLGAQLREGYASALAAAGEGAPSGEGVSSIVVCGMGGSGVAGDIVRVLFADRLPEPVVVVKGYALPEFCGRDTLVIAISFSGNTEETLSAYGEAVARGCRVVAASAGGELADRAAADGVRHLRISDRVSMPRAALGYLAAAPLGLLQGVGLLPDLEEEVGRTAELLDELATSLGPRVPVAGNEAKDLAAWIGGRAPVIWGSEGIAEAAAVRWKTQFNENAKRPAFASVLPELDHNEIEGWSEGSGVGFAAVVLRHGHEHPRVEARLDATLRAIAGSGLEARHVEAPGTDRMGSLFGAIMIGDLVSTYVALADGRDPTPVPVLMGLKKELAQA